MARRVRGIVVNLLLFAGTAIAIALLPIQPFGSHRVTAALPPAVQSSSLQPVLASPFPKGISSSNASLKSAPKLAFTTLASGSVEGYTPRQETAWADPTNYGDRFATDAFGNPVQNPFIVVLHETVGSANSAINTFRTPHPRDEDQVSYHTLIRLDGTVVYIVPPEKRAFGAGNSIFNGPNGPETVVTNPAFPGSVNNFAYHVSLETPSDGRGNTSYHSGYTQNQYLSLAWLLAQTDVPDNRITTHRAVDRSGNRLDPRSFDGHRFLSLLNQYIRPI
jgi:hypothetical protein